MKNWAFKERPCVSISEIVTLTSTKKVLYFYFHSNIYVEGFIFLKKESVLDEMFRND